MRRPPGLWILLSAGKDASWVTSGARICIYDTDSLRETLTDLCGKVHLLGVYRVVWLSLQDAYGLRATSLIFGKTTTTTTTTAKPAEEPEAAEETVTATDLSNDSNATKPTLTGNPQLDYIWDPNLPQELNGYNLSDYPFYERVPEDIDFKCDGLHDGFYASVAHKCQVYHHCLFGTRYDFLCANYTAFDQKTFICHFASEVDCANSKKFWHRNDALYKAATTTTIKPLVIYTTAPPLSPEVPLTSAPLPSLNPGQRRPVGGRRRPFRRRRPQYEYYDDEYYDDYYEERPRSNRGRKRPRPRPRPVYDDDYEEDYEEDRYQRRGVGSRREEERRQYDRRAGNRRKNKDRPKDDYEDEEADGDSEDEEYEDNRRKPNERRQPEVSEEDRYPGNRKRRPYNDRTEDYDKPVSRKGQRQPPKDDYEDDSLQLDDSKSFERPRKNSEKRNKPRGDTRTIIKPVSGTIYDRPRVAPRIKLPVPKNEADKYAYKPVGAQDASASPEEEKEYYEEYEEPTAVRNNRRKPQSDGRIRDRDSPRKTSSASRQRRPDGYDIEDGSRSKATRDKPKRPASEEYYDDYEEEEEEKEVQKPSAIINSEKRAKVSTTTSTSTTTTEAPLEKIAQPVVRMVKRPFLPSRGGNPYAARGLQPVGNKAVHRTPEKVLGEDSPGNNVKKEEAFEPSPPLSRVPIIPQTTELQKPYQSQNPAGPRTTQKPKLPEHNPLDINEEDYDVTLNDALNPTLPNIPIRGSPVGFGPGSDYSFASSQRPRYTVDPVASPASSEYIYQAKPLRQTYQPQRDQFVQSNTEYTGQYSNYRPRQAQQQTEVYHHCLFGTRYDFLCANYTAFDQTLFNCNFVSNVDCENSKKFWHRNDELYIEKSTTTAAPAINYNFYTPPPQAAPLTPSSVGDLSPEAVAPRRQPVRPRANRPPARPLYDYYDDYEELPRPKSRKRPRPRPRPVYYDDYEEYEDVRLERRGGGRRRPYSRRDRPVRRNKDRRKLDYEDAEYSYEDDDLVLGKKQKAKRRKMVDDYEYEDDVIYEKRRPPSRRDKPKKKTPIEDYDYEEEERLNRRNTKGDIEPVKRRPLNGESKKIPRLGKRRPPSEEYEDDLQQADDPRSYERPRKNKGQTYIKPTEDGRPIIKPVSGTIYDRPRVAPRINLPVPKNAADKFAYKPLGAPTTPIAKLPEEEYDDYDETPAQPANDKKPASSRMSVSMVKEDYPQSKPKSKSATSEATVEESLDDYEDQLPKVEKTQAQSTTTTTEQPVDRSPMPIIRKYKRPFLPSRGGNPYATRNIQPVGTKAKEDSQEIDLGESSIMKSVADPAKMSQGDKSKFDEMNTDFKQAPEKAASPKVTITAGAEESTLRSAMQGVVNEDPKPGVIRIKVPIRMKPYLEQDGKSQNIFGNNRFSVPEPSTTPQQAKLLNEDVLNGNYDVSLNEAISPIIPNIPVRSFGGYNPPTDYSYKRFQRPTKYVILDPVVSAGNAYYVK